MVAQYTVLGRQVGSHYLAMATLGTMALGTFLSMGGKQKAKQQGPPINATSKDEEQFIQEFIKSANAEEQKAKH
ncbi:hypothetical protein MMC12_007633 [Toensbergia leucococca]|nr:hypothetical protein [Toensbergia leucococca]